MFGKSSFIQGDSSYMLIPMFFFNDEFIQILINETFHYLFRLFVAFNE